jgi:hypothetical protein
MRTVRHVGNTLAAETRRVYTAEQLRSAVCVERGFRVRSVSGVREARKTAELMGLAVKTLEIGCNVSG